MARKIACGSWRTAGDPSVYALLEIEMSKALEFAEAYSKQHGVRITPTHLAAKAITHCLEVAARNSTGFCGTGRFISAGT